MNYFDHANHLVSHAEDELDRIKTTYESSLEEKSVKPALLIAIKNLMENLRSALEYSAHGLFAMYGSSSKSKPKVYFPYALAGQSKEEFQKSDRIEVCIPGIGAARPDIVTLLESYQAFAALENGWLPVFMDLNNENKHQQLTPQTRKEAKQLNISSGETSINLGGVASISMGPGTSIRMGGLTIPGGQRFDSSNPPRTHGQGSIEVIRWVSFHFSHNDEPVLPILEQAVKGVGQIISDLASE